MLRLVTTAVCALTLALGFSGIAFGDHSHARSFDARDYGYQRGYSNGFHQGLNDREHHNKFKAEVKDTDNGYEKSMGDKDQYREGYRSGFIAGYDDAVNNRPGRFSQIYGPYNEGVNSADRSADLYSGWSASHIASDIGYRDGLAAGQADYDSHRGPRPEDQHDFKNADHGYRSSYGDKSLYEQQYREAFMQGYRDAYSGRR